MILLSFLHSLLAPQIPENAQISNSFIVFLHKICTETNQIMKHELEDEMFHLICAEIQKIRENIDEKVFFFIILW